MSALMKAIREKYKDPRDALKALGLDAKLMEGEGSEDTKKDDDDDKAKDADPREFLKSKLSEDDMKSYDAMCEAGKSALDAEEDDDDKKKAKDAKEDDDEEKQGAASTIKDKAKDRAKDEPPVTKAAMDAALIVATDANAKRVREAERGIRVALGDVEPWVGRLAPSLAMDSAADVYRHAAVALGVRDAKKLHADALFPIIQAQPKPGERAAPRSEAFAMDSSSYDAAAKHAPGLARITVGA